MDFRKLIAEAKSIAELNSAFDSLDNQSLAKAQPELQASKEQLNEAEKVFKQGRRKEERVFVQKLVAKAISEHVGQHEYRHVRGLEDSAVFYNSQYPNLPIVLSKKVIKALISHKMTPLSAVALHQVGSLLSTMRFTGDREKTIHAKDRNQGVLYWEVGEAKLVIEDRVYLVRVKVKCFDRGLQDSDSLSPYTIRTDLMTESLSEAQGGISRKEPESCRFTLNPQSMMEGVAKTLTEQSSLRTQNTQSSPTNSIYNDQVLSKYLEPFEIECELDTASEQQLGRTSYVVTAKGDEVETGFKLVDDSELIPSNNSDGKINPRFPQELQPRDRTRVTSIAQINKMANGLRPAQLTDSGLSSHGAPIIGKDKVVESGNGRTMAIMKAYQEGKADDYRQYLIDNADRFGFTPEQVKKLDRPVLVRERVTELDRAKFAKDSNLSDLQQMSSSEVAWSDAERINDNMMALFNPSESGNLLGRENQAFLNSFLTEIGDNSTAGLLTDDGRPTKQLIERMQNAVFAKAYKNEKLVKLVAEEPDPEIRNILNAMNGAAAQFVEMQYLDGEVHKQAVGVVADAVEINKASPTLAEEALDSLVRATELVRQAKDTGQDINELLAQSGLFGDNDPEAEALARFISANNRSAKRLTLAFKAMATAINQELTTQGSAIGDMFGGGGATLVDILGRVNQELENEGVQSGFMFESARVDALANEAATSPLNDRPEPTKAQKEAGNYKKGRLMFSGFNIVIENPKGSLRKGTDPDGNEWSIELKNHYGDIAGTRGADGDPVDVFLGENEKPKHVFIVNQNHSDGEFDEHKVMLGFDSKADALAAYLSNYEAGWNGVRSVVKMTISQFEWWLRTGNEKKPARPPARGLQLV